MTDLQSLLVRADGFVPKERYTTDEFAELEQTRLWACVWQIAGREEQVGRPGDFLEYTIGDETVFVVRAAGGELHAFYNACLHRGRRLVEGSGSLAEAALRCPYHGWCYGLDGRVIDVPDRDEFDGLPDDLRLVAVRVDTWGGFVFVNLDPQAEPLLEFLDPIPALLGPYHLEQMRLRASLSTVIDANWKAVVDAFNEGYHVQGLHTQILPWTDDVSIEYETIGRHAHYGRLPGARRRLRPSPRLHLSPGEYDEGEILANLVAGLGGAFLGEERAAIEELRAAGPPSGSTLLEAYQARRMQLLEARGFDVSGLSSDLMTSADDVFWFPNVVGPIYPGSAILFRVRPYGRDPNRSIKDTWVLEWRAPETPEAAEANDGRCVQTKFFENWRDRNWGEITEQDYENLANVQAGMRSAGWTGARLNPRQEGNILHMHRVIDGYITARNGVGRD
ncbi:MAG TPA: aromatic ring-hydroxylating dioxygenase subunit alpha [Acidimicrobiia bacterium]|nr:aromatic ring-hydroxylating dioxygenase subunit alpha [Acidimicrobiia bacterium]